MSQFKAVLTQTIRVRYFSLYSWNMSPDCDLTRFDVSYRCLSSCEIMVRRENMADNLYFTPVSVELILKMTTNHIYLFP